MTFRKDKPHLFLIYLWGFGGKTMKNWTIEEMLVENSKVNRGTLKKRLLSEKILENKCYECGAEPFWNNKPLVMIIDHINGTNNDNRIENLRMLCPNCNSQQDTFSGRNVKKIPQVEKICVVCGSIHFKKSLSCSNECKNILRRQDRENIRKFNPSKGELENLVFEIPMTEIAKIYGVSGTSVKSRCVRLGIKLPPSGFFIKGENHGNVKGEKNPNFGKEFSLERKEKISKVLSGRELSDTHKQNISVSQKRRMQNRK